jgi:dienelactone hydrolase
MEQCMITHARVLFRLSSLTAVASIAALLAPAAFSADTPATVPVRELRDLNKSYFPFTPVKSKEEWAVRRAEILQRTQVACGLVPMPTKTPLNPVIHGRVERDDYTVDKVYFESVPGHFVTGNLYLPKKPGEKMPVVLCPHGHWPNGRFMNLNDAGVKKEIATGAERFENAARSPLQARCVQLARMGCAVFHYDMLGYADSLQFADASGNIEHRHGPKAHGFVSPDAESQLVGYFNLQTWNSIRALDFVLSLPGVDPTRVGCTGASGGGTQTMILSGLDERVTAAYPCVMVSTAMQGGCTCENTNHLRIDQGNIDFAALTAPRPLGMTTANDWTKELDTKGFPDLKNLYTMLGVPNNVTALFAPHFPHNYNHVSRTAMYNFYNKHFKLGLEEPVLERDFQSLSEQEMSVWDAKHPKPTGDKIGEAHEKALVKWFAEDTAKQTAPLLAPKTEADVAEQREVLGAGWQVLIGGKMPAKGESVHGLGTKEDKGDYLLMSGTTTSKLGGVDTTFIYPKQWNNSVVLWVSLKGEASILDGNGDLTSAATKLLAEGFSIACPNLYMKDAKKNPNVYDDGKKKLDSFYGYAGYQYGYNPSLFAERVRDVMASIAMIRDNDKYRTETIYVAGVEGAGPIAAAAVGVAQSKVNQLFVDTEGFRFAKLNDVWDMNFVPGAVKYGDVPALLSLCAPVKTTVVNETKESIASAVATFGAGKASLEVVGKAEESGTDAVVKALVERR